VLTQRKRGTYATDRGKAQRRPAVGIRKKPALCFLGISWMWRTPCNLGIEQKNLLQEKNCSLAGRRSQGILSSRSKKKKKSIQAEVGKKRERVYYLGAARRISRREGKKKSDAMPSSGEKKVLGRESTGSREGRACASASSSKKEGKDI